MTGYDPYDPYRDDRRDRGYDDRGEPYQDPPPWDPYADLPGQQPSWQRPDLAAEPNRGELPPWERPDLAAEPGRDEFPPGPDQGRHAGGGYGGAGYEGAGYGGEPSDAPPFLRGNDTEHYGSAGSDPGATQAYVPVDPSFGPPATGGEMAPPSFWDGLDAPPAPPRPERREPSPGGYWDRIAEAPSAYASTPDREPATGGPPANHTETYPPAPASPPGHRAHGGDEPVDSPYGREPVDSPYRDSPWDSPWDSGGAGHADAGSGYADAGYGGVPGSGASGYGGPAYDDSAYGSSYGDRSHGAHQEPPYQDSPYRDSPYQEPPYQDSPYREPRYQDSPYQDSPYGDASYGRSEHGDYPDAGYGDRAADFRPDPGPDPRYAASAESTQAFSMPFDAPEPTDTPPEGYGPRSRSGYADRSPDPYGPDPYGPGPDAAGGAFAGGAYPGAAAGGTLPGAMPGAMPGAVSDTMPGAPPDAFAPEAPAPGRPPAGPYAPSTSRAEGEMPPGAMPPATDTDEFGDSGHLPSAYDAQAPIPRRVDLPDEVLAPLGTGGRRLADEDGDAAFERPDARDPYGRGQGPDPTARRGAATQDHDAARQEQQQNNTPATIGIWTGVVIGLGLAATSALGFGLPALVGTIGAAVVAWMLTMVLVRRGLGMDWWVSGLAGVIPGALVLGSAIAPDWFRTATVLYVAASAGAAAMVLTKPVRRLSELVLEYVVAVGVAFAGGGAVAGLSNGEPIGLGLPSLAVALGFGLTLAAASRAQARLASVAPSRTDLLVYVGLVAAATIGAASLAVLLGAGDGALGSIAERVEDLILDFRLIVIVPLALLGSAVVVRAFTPVGWWICAVAALSTTAMASSFASTNPRGRIDIAPTLASSFVGYVLGFLVTVGVAFLIGLRMRSASARRARGGKPSRYVDEPGRLGTF